MQKFNVKNFSKEINIPYYSLIRIYNKYKCSNKEDLLKAIEANKKFHIGDKFGNLTIISENTINKNSQLHVFVKCVCGKEYFVPLSDLKKRNRQSCTNCKAIHRRIPINIGEIYGDWEVIEGPIKGIHKNSLVYLCKCTCGNTQYCSAYDLKNKNTKRCFKCSRKIGIEKMMDNNGRIGELNISKYNKIKKSAFARNIEFTVNIEYLWDLYIKQNKKCAITGDYIDSFKEASLDRIDSSKGYIEGNVQWVTYRANVSKHTMSMKELYEFCIKVINYANQQPSQPLTKLEGSETND